MGGSNQRGVVFVVWRERVTRERNDCRAQCVTVASPVLVSGFLLQKPLISLVLAEEGNSATTERKYEHT